LWETNNLGAPHFLSLAANYKYMTHCEFICEKKNTHNRLAPAEKDWLKVKVYSCETVDLARCFIIYKLGEQFSLRLNKYSQIENKAITALLILPRLVAVGMIDK